MLIDKIEYYFNNNISFAFARFNDGELGGILNTDFVASRGAQGISSKLQSKLKESILFKKENYWIGIPCPKCYPKFHEKAKSMIGGYEYETLAVNLINENYIRTKCIFKKYLKGKSIYWVGGDDQVLTTFAQKYNVKIKRQYKLPTKNAFSSYNHIFDEYKNFEKDSIVILSLGPLERILAKEWFELNDKVTYLGLGSFFDPITRNVKHRYHLGDLHHCSVCNRKNILSRIADFLNKQSVRVKHKLSNKNL